MYVFHCIELQFWMLLKMVENNNESKQNMFGLLCRRGIRLLQGRHNKQMLS